MIQVIIPDSKVVKEMSQKVSFSTAQKDTRLNLASTSQGQSRLKALFPFDVSKHRNKIALMIKENKIELNFPRVFVKSAVQNRINSRQASAQSKTAKAPARKKELSKKGKSEYLDEDYLNSLIKIEEPAQKAGAGKGKALANKVIRPAMESDEVKVTLSGTQKNQGLQGKSSFSLIEYGGKFVAFLAIVILMFYGIVTLMKKGFIKKGKLGFLNKTEQIQVLSQTYIAPKKSLMMVRAHNQVFLVSNTDSGIHPISEIRDVAGLLKDGELKIAGDNFDTNLGSASANEAELDERVKLKEDITQSNKESSLSDYMGVKDRVKFSEQIKKKVKNLKPLHQ